MGSVAAKSFSFEKFVKSFFGFLITAVLQYITALLIVFVISILFFWIDLSDRFQWFVMLFLLWLGFNAGIAVVGWLILRKNWHPSGRRMRARLAATAVCCLVPLVVLLIIGLGVEPGGVGSRFEEVITFGWQPSLAQAALGLGILAFHIPGWFKLRE
jgi:hypothetical protein